MRKVAFLSTDNLEDFFVYDDMLIAPFAEAGWEASSVSWHAKNHDFSQYEMVIVRSTWDYQQYPEAFSACLQRISEQETRLENPLPVLLWNMEKSYLKDLQGQGVTIVPTLWSTGCDSETLQQAFSDFSTSELIVKPTLSANADDTFRVSQSSLINQVESLSQCFENRSCMIQPFLDSVLNEGEYSLFYFSGTYSHGIIKRPKTGDFRVQEEHGGSLASIIPDADMLAVAQQALKAIPEPTLYARVDLLRLGDKWAVMELELIEPSLYFNLDPDSPQRFVNACLAHIGQVSSLS